MTLAELDQANASKRLWAKDGSLWKTSKAEQQAIAERLGWLNSREWAATFLAEYANFAQEARRKNIRDVLLLGMGGSSLAPDCFRQTFGHNPGYPRLTVLDTTDCGAVRSARSRIDPRSTWIIVSSKSGGTIETSSLFEYFFQELNHEGSRFSCITDPGTDLERLAREKGFRRVFHGQPDVGGRYSVLSPFGLVPAAAMGLELPRFLESARLMAQACGPDVPPTRNPGFQLGFWMAEMALAGRDKLTFILSPKIQSFGGWVEQLVAESLGKEGKGVLPVVGEEPIHAGSYGKDRAFVYLRLAGGHDPKQDDSLAALKAAQLPLRQFDLQSPHDLGGEMFRWMVATAAAGIRLGVNPFDQPDVQLSKDITKEVLAAAAPPSLDPALSPATLEQAAQAAAALVDSSGPGDYLALLAYVEGAADELGELAALRSALARRKNLASTVGLGPRYLHSTGQMHKGGPNNGIFLVLTASGRPDVPVPGKSYGFARLQSSQARGDMLALTRRGRRALHVELGPRPSAGLQRLTALLRPN